MSFKKLAFKLLTINFARKQKERTKNSVVRKVLALNDEHVGKRGGKFVEAWMVNGDKGTTAGAFAKRDLASVSIGNWQLYWRRSRVESWDKTSFLFPLLFIIGNLMRDCQTELFAFTVIDFNSLERKGMTKRAASINLSSACRIPLIYDFRCCLLLIMK